MQSLASWYHVPVMSDQQVANAAEPADVKRSEHIQVTALFPWWVVAPTVGHIVEYSFHNTHCVVPPEDSSAKAASDIRV